MQPQRVTVVRTTKARESRGKRGTPAYVRPLSEPRSALDSPPGQKMSTGEAVLLCCSLLSLVVSCILWSSRKQEWVDEIYTWTEVNDRSLWHLYSAIQHGADGGMPLFYTTAWAWAKIFGGGTLALRLYSCLTSAAQWSLSGGLFAGRTECVRLRLAL